MRLGDKVLIWNYVGRFYMKGIISDVTKQWYRINCEGIEYARHESEIHLDREKVS